MLKIIFTNGNYVLSNNGTSNIHSKLNSNSQFIEIDVLQLDENGKPTRSSVSMVINKNSIQCYFYEEYNIIGK
jgi:hypothetical protein